MSTARSLPIWAVPTEFTQTKFSASTPKERQDVVVIGAGVAGLVTALCLVQDGRRVLVADRQGLGAGESLRTTAHLASALDDRFYHLARWHGKDGARLAAESHAAAIDWIEDFVDSLPGKCGFRRVPGYLFSHDGDTGRLRKECDAADEAGLSVTYVDQGIPGLPDLGHALRFDHQARIEMDRYVLALAEACDALGVRFLMDEIAEIEGGEAPTLTNVKGETLRAEAIVVATNVPFHERIAIHTKQAAYRSYVVAGPVGGGAVPDALLWDDGDPYHYVRIAEAADGRGPLLVVGGEDHKTGQDADPKAFVRLQEWTREHFPGIESFTHGWSGQIIEPADGLAFIGADPAGEKNVYIVTGDSGNGVTHGTLAGLLLADLIMGRQNPWAELYDPKRKSVRSPGGWARENVNVALQYSDWLSSGDLPTLDELALGEGGVLRHGIHRIAAYRNRDGEISMFSARCPHLGCAVRWSPQEKSWDCPCHGSRFDAQTGAVLNGPAKDPLAPFAWPSAVGDDS